MNACSEKTKEMMRQIFNEVLKQEDCFHRKGDVEEAGKYRPICTLPALYKLFSTLLCNRLYPRLDCVQPGDQGGFRRSYRTLDHLATYRLLEQKCREWSVKMRVASVHFRKHLSQEATNNYGAHWSNAGSSHNAAVSGGGSSQNRKRQF